MSRNERISLGVLAGVVLVVSFWLMPLATISVIGLIGLLVLAFLAFQKIRQISPDKSRDFLQRWFAVSIRAKSLLDWKVFVSGVILLLGGISICLVLPWWASLAILGGPLTIAVVALILAFTVNVAKWGGTFLRFRDVPANTTLVLRYRFFGDKSAQEGYDPRKDKTLYSSLSSGLVLYSPWFFAQATLVNTAPFVIVQKGEQVNAHDGPLIAIDTQVTASVTDPILFFLNVSNDIEKMRETIKEYLNTALARMASVDKKEKVKLPFLAIDPQTGKKEHQTIQGWDSTLHGLTSSIDRDKQRMGTFVSALMNHWFKGTPEEDEQSFGFQVKVKITNLNPPKTFLSAQEAASAAKFQAKETVAQARAGAKAVKVLSKAATKSLSPQLKASLEATISNPSASDETKKSAIELLTKALPNSTVLTAISSLLPSLRDLMEVFIGGKRSKNSSES